MDNILKQLRTNLHHGEIREVCRRTGFSITTVSKTLNGKLENPNTAIIEAAMQVIADRRKREIEMEQKIKNFINAWCYS